jgi:hypothetical protein
MFSNVTNLDFMSFYFENFLCDNRTVAVFWRSFETHQTAQSLINVTDGFEKRIGVQEEMIRIGPEKIFIIQICLQLVPDFRRASQRTKMNVLNVLGFQPALECGLGESFFPR